MLADLSDPLNHLLKKDTPWEWSSECQESFTKLKEALTSTTVLAHYDPMMSIALACDVSSIGIGTVIYHVYHDGIEKRALMYKKCHLHIRSIHKLKERPLV